MFKVLCDYINDILSLGYFCVVEPTWAQGVLSRVHILKLTFFGQGIDIAD
jgi:hypothetical protein